MQLVNHIVIENGKAYIAGHNRLKAEMVARMVVDGDYPVEEVMAHYGLNAAEVYAALSYYYDNQAELDAANEQKWSDVHSSAVNAEELLNKLKSRKD